MPEKWNKQNGEIAPSGFAPVLSIMKKRNCRGRFRY